MRSRYTQRRNAVAKVAVPISVSAIELPLAVMRSRVGCDVRLALRVVRGAAKSRPLGIRGITVSSAQFRIGAFRSLFSPHWQAGRGARQLQRVEGVHTAKRALCRGQCLFKVVAA